MKRVDLILLLFIFVLPFNAFAQKGSFSGSITDSDGKPLLGASVIITNHIIGTVASDKGTFELSVPHNQPCYVECSFLGYTTVRDTIQIKKGGSLNRTYILEKKISEVEGVTVFGIQDREKSLTRINMKSIDQLPNTTGNIESILKSFSGVVSGNELSSQYSVRGGNYDENLIYVNDIEIHRPLLVQSAMQEGLSFVNPNMVSAIQFSAGGFDAEFGDKLSSVLDIQYKNPTKFEGTAMASLLGGSLHLAGITQGKKITYNTSVRYKTSQYLLNSLDVTGEYVPRFIDYQGLFTYNFSKNTKLSFLGNYSTNQFNMVPQKRETDFGTIQKIIRLTVYYDGQEQDLFDSYMGAFSLSHSPNENVSLKFIGTAFRSNETITKDILSEYYLSQINKTQNQTDTSINIGTGLSLEHERKYLESLIYSFEHKGSYFGDVSTWKWGAKIQSESIDDDFNEWRFLDSAGMSYPYSDSTIYLDYAESGKNSINGLRYQGFLQNHTQIHGNNSLWGITGGVRFNYSDFNKNLLISPRISLNVEPYWERKIKFYFSTGLYGQPPFYKEYKDYTGDLYPEKRAQKSVHFVVGGDYYYQMWGRSFIFTSELYYKYLYDIIPYKVNDIQVQYLPGQNSEGYAQGLDFRIYGEFVPGTESWFSLSLLKTRERLTKNSLTNLGLDNTSQEYYRRPTDQTLTFSIFFQDYVPSFPDYKVHLLLNYGTGLPYSGPNLNRPDQVFMLNQYKRVDIGFSRIIKRKKHKSIGLNDIWISAEILNLLDAKNMASYDWVKTVENNEGEQESYAIPNYLTGRRFNIKISTKL